MSISPFDQTMSYNITVISPNGDVKIDNLTLSNIHCDGFVYKGTDTNGTEHSWNVRLETQVLVETTPLPGWKMVNGKMMMLEDSVMFRKDSVMKALDRGLIKMNSSNALFNSLEELNNACFISQDEISKDNEEIFIIE